MSSSIVFPMSSVSPLLTASVKRLAVALLVASWSVDIWLSSGRSEIRMATKDRTCRPIAWVLILAGGHLLYWASRPGHRSSSRRPHERCEVADWPEVGQLVGVDDRVDACDLTAGDVERHHGDQPLLCIEVERSWAAVDLDGARRYALKALAEADPADERAGDTGAAAQRVRQGGDLAAAVAGRLNIVGEQRLEPSEIAFLGGLKEPSCQPVALLARRLEAGPALLDVASGAGGELAHVIVTLADDRRDLRIPIVEHVVKQQHGSLLRRDALQQHQQGQRQRVGRLSVPGRIIVAVGDDRLRQPLADIALAAGARGAQLVDRQPGGHGGDEGARRCDLLAGLERLMHPQQR